MLQKLAMMHHVCTHHWPSPPSQLAPLSERINDLQLLDLNAPLATAAFINDGRKWIYPDDHIIEVKPVEGIPHFSVSVFKNKTLVSIDKLLDNPFPREPENQILTKGVTVDLLFLVSWQPILQNLALIRTDMQRKTIYSPPDFSSGQYETHAIGKMWELKEPFGDIQLPSRYDVKMLRSANPEVVQKETYRYALRGEKGAAMERVLIREQVDNVPLTSFNF